MTGLVDDVRRWVTGEPSVAALLDRVARELTRELAVDGCLVFLVAAEGDLVLTAGHPPPGGPELRLPRGFGVTGRVAVDGVPAVLVDDHPRNPRHRQVLGLGADEPVSRLCVPARVPGPETVGVLALSSRRRRVFPPSEIGTVQVVADLLALRIRLSTMTGQVDEYRQLWDNAVVTSVTIQEAERRRIAGDLHDGVTQAIASLSFHLSAARAALRDGDTTDAAEQVEAARSLADVAYGETRSAITGLHSPTLDDLGLSAGLTSLARSVPHLPIEVDAQDLPLTDPVATSLFRVAQEALHNIVRHADAGSALIRLARHGHTVLLSIADDGRGFETSRRDLRRAHASGSPYGLRGIAERVRLIGGELSISSAPGEGTTIEVRVPDVVGRRD